MKALYKFLTAAVMAGSFASCSTDIEMPKLQGFDNLDPRELIASTNEVVMEGVNESNEAVTLTWGDYQLSVDNPSYAGSGWKRQELSGNVTNFRLFTH